MNMLNHFEKIVALFRNEGFTESFLESSKENLDAVSGLLEITHIQTALLSIIMEYEPIGIKKLGNLLKLTKIQMYQYMDDLDSLKNKKLVKQTQIRGTHGYSEALVVPIKVINGLRNGGEFEFDNYKNLEPEEFLKSADVLLSDISSGFGSISDIEELTIEINLLTEANKNLAFVKKSKEYGLREGSVIVLLIFCCMLIFNEEDVVNLSVLSGILGNRTAKDIIKRIKSGEHKLLNKGLIEPANVNGMADTEFFKLTQKAKDDFLSDVDLKKLTRRKGKNIIHADDIKDKKLFYNSNITESINELIRLLDKDNFFNIQKRLLENGMRSGFNCLFSGPPGTGKTETVYQIARATGRDIYLVDISETKSAWFGESEKRIKEVFDRYKGIVSSNELTPILLFNEADAVLGKRQELAGVRQGPGQTENAMQNIILQEMENMNGILIATTNMTANLDKAFERRFLYKIEFDKPDAQTKSLIWQNFIPRLSGEEARSLANQFDYTGGQIENIVRKSAVSQILNGEDASFEKIMDFCREETLDKEAKRIGFTS